MQIKKYLVEERKTKFLLFNIKTNETLECQKIEGVWHVINKHETKKLTSDDLYRLIFDFGSFVDKRRRPYRVLFSRDVAIFLVRKGYILLDSDMNRYEYQNEVLLRNGKEQLADLPELTTYILLPFQKFIEEKVQKETKVVSSSCEQIHETEKKFIRKARRRRKMEEREEENKYTNKPVTTNKSNVWDWVMLVAGGVGITALACWLRNSNTNYKNKLCYGNY